MNSILLLLGQLHIVAFAQFVEKRIPLDVKDGDRIVFSKYGYDEVKLDDGTYYIVGESSILGIITNK